MINTQPCRSLFAASLVIASLFLGACSKQESSRPLDQEPINAKGDRSAETTDVPQKPGVETTGTWVTKDPEIDGIEGVSADRAYIDLNLRTGVEPILVAVIDSGIDIEHEDLAAHIWKNPGETGVDKNGRNKASNNIDDDKNGYVDDIHGWNFLGSVDKTGKPVHIDATTLEVTRELVRMKKLKVKRELSEEEAAYLAHLDAEVAKARTDATTSTAKVQGIKDAMKARYEVLKTLLAVEFEKVTLAMVTALQPTEEVRKMAQAEFIELFKKNNLTNTARLDVLLQRYDDQLKYYFNESFDPRKQIIGDNPYRVEQQRGYGNNDVEGPGADHGTHVAGIIGAVRGNNLGIDGIATDVRIMALRAVPNGDEYDKDIANAVRYATDNGARVINMSFGKGYSPLKTKVDEAFMYAASKGVLIIHSAGNDAKLNTDKNNFPNKHVKASVADIIPNWIEVAASSKTKGLNLPAYFSNYGKETVDIFAPGFEVLSSVPGNQYAAFSGTSMAGPCVAGVGALILSQHPNFTGEKVRELVLSTARAYPGLEVYKPSVTGEKNVVAFDSLTVTGGAADVLAALKKAR
ncbi:MAG: S8 family serine peptidase [Bdellovibrionales bacterium]